MNHYQCKNFDPGRTVTLPIEIFKKYVRRDGQVIEASPPHPETPNEFIRVGGPGQNGNVVHRKTGLHNSFRGMHPLDLISDHIETTVDCSGD